MVFSWLKRQLHSQPIQLKRIAIGKTPATVTELGLGTAPLGNLYRPISDKEAIQTIQRAFQLGIRLFDTAPFYGRTASETRLGQALEGIPRDEYILSTKVGRIVSGTRITFDFSKDGLLRSLDSSLKRLKVDRVDIVHLHDPDEHYQQALNEGFPTLARLREQGLVSAISVGMNQWQMLLEFSKHADFDGFMLAGRYTLLEQTALDFLDFCQQKGISVLAAGVYNSGILANIADAKYNYKTAPDSIQEKARKLAAICREFSVPLRSAAIQFVRMHPAIAALVIGAESPKQIEETATAFSTSIPDEFWRVLKQQELIAPASPTNAISS